MFQYLKKVIMGLASKYNNLPKQPKKMSQPEGIQLDAFEVEHLLLAVREADFKGKNIERVWTLIVKLQEYYKRIS